MNKDRLYTVIHMLGLAFGMACSLIILTYVRSELNYDRFHEDAPHIYRLLYHAEVNGNPRAYPAVGFNWAQIVTKEIPQIEGTARMFGGFGAEIINGEEAIFEDNVLFVDSSFTDIFQLEWVVGNPHRALLAPNQVVLTESVASRYYGNENPVGKPLVINWTSGHIPITVSGVVKDYPTESHFDLGFLVTMPTLRQAYEGFPQIFTELDFTSFFTYVKTRMPGEVKTSLDQLFQTHLPQRSKDRLKSIALQPLTDIHLHSHSVIELKPSGNALYVRIFLAAGILILLIAAINYINLATARAANRSKEVGMRKVVGAFRIDIIRQFLGESILLAFVSMVLAVLLAEIIRFVLKQTIQVHIESDFLTHPFTFLLLLGSALFIGLIAGSYPALFLSAFRPVEVLRGSLLVGIKGGRMRKILVIVQFTISTAMMIWTAIVFKQLLFIEHMDLGYERNNQVVIFPPVIGGDMDKTIPILKGLKNAYMQSPDVINASFTNGVPGHNRAILQVKVAGRPDEQVYEPLSLKVDYDFAETMDLQLLTGRNFDQNFSTDAEQAVLINEAAAINMALDSPVVNTELLLLPQPGSGEDTIRQLRIVGVIKDMHFKSIYYKISPMVISLNPGTDFILVVRIRPDNTTRALEFLENTFYEMIEGEQFYYSFLDDDLAALYQSEQQLGKLLSFFALLAILIACLGLFGLSAFTTSHRQKEISIRKVLGAKVAGIIGLITKEFLLLVLVAIPLASALAWWASNFWLETFAYHVEIGLAPYILMSLLSLLIAFLTVSFHAFKAAYINPADALNVE